MTVLGTQPGVGVQRALACGPLPGGEAPLGAWLAHDEEVLSRLGWKGWGFSH